MGQQTSTPKITQQDKAIFQLKQQRDKVKQYQRSLTVLMNKQTELAKKAVLNKEMDKAKFYLKSRKQQDSTIKKTYDQLDNLEHLINTIEFKLIEKDVMYGLAEGNKVLTKLNSGLKVENIEKILDDLEDNKVKVDEVSELLGTGLTNSEEAEIDDELESLEREVNGTKTDKIVLPDAPKSELKSPEKEQQKKHEEVEESQPQLQEPLAL